MQRQAVFGRPLANLVQRAFGFLLSPAQNHEVIRRPSIVREISVSLSERKTAVQDRLPLSKEWYSQRILRMGRIKEERREARGRRRFACDESETGRSRIHRPFLSTLDS